MPTAVLWTGSASARWLKPPMPSWLDEGLAHLWLPYTQMQTTPPPLPVARTEGMRIHLADGRVLVDGIASWWTACHGYNHPHIREAVQRQLEVMPHVMFGGIVHEQPLTLARKLSEILPGDLDRVFFTDSGSVSNTLVPSSTFPARATAPARASKASANVVVPAPLWPTRATLRILSVGILLTDESPFGCC